MTAKAAPAMARGNTAPELMGPEAVRRSMDRCTKCGVCQAHCPVANVTERFAGPKHTGPQAQRFRVIEATMDTAPSLCSCCGICTSVCPNGVAIADIITLARAEQVKSDDHLPLRQRLLNRPDVVGRFAGMAPAIANAILGNHALRALAESTIGVHRDAPLPQVAGPRFRRWLARQTQPEGNTVAYFSGCAVEHYDPDVGIAAVRLLNRLGLRVDAPSRACCALPMLSSGEWRPVRNRAATLIGDLSPAAAAGRAIVSTSTSCSLTLRTKYAAYLDLRDEAARGVANAVVDLCEFLRDDHADCLAKFLRPLPARALYHGPCQLRGHKMGLPALELLHRVPDLSVALSRADCCGVAGTYGYDSGKHEIAMAVGASLFERIDAIKPDFIVCDSETCRWHIEQATGLPCRHPVEILAASIFGGDPAQRPVMD